MLRKLWAKVKNFVKWLLKTLGDKMNIIIFVIVLLVVSCEVWIPYLIAIITGNEWWWAVGSACWAFWLAPFTPFIPLCIALTAAVRKIYDKIKKNYYYNIVLLIIQVFRKILIKKIRKVKSTFLIKI